MIQFVKGLKHKLSHGILKKYNDPVLNQNCSQFEVDNWIISEFILNELIPIIGLEPFPLNEQMLMVGSVCRFKPSHIFEWGTNIGKSARIWYETVYHFNIGSEIHSIDLPEYVDHIEHPHKNRGALVKGINEVHLHEGDGLSTTLDLLKTMNNQSRPLFFLDGDHQNESVARELKGIISACMNPIIIIHDTFYQSKESKYNIGPYLAIKNFLSDEKDFLKISTNTGLPGLTLLFKPSSLWSMQ
jgi:cephalosporin hydroxylase